MLITHWLNLLRARKDQGPGQDAPKKGSRGTHYRLRPFAAAILPPWFTRRLQPVMVTPTTRRVRQLRSRQRLS